VAGGFGYKFNAHGVVRHDAGYFYRFRGVQRRNHPQADLGGVALDFNPVADNLAYVPRLKQLTAVRVFHVPKVGYVRGFLKVIADGYFNEGGEFLHVFEHMELKDVGVLAARKVVGIELRLNPVHFFFGFIN